MAKVLLIEDDDAIRHIVATLLTDQGYEVLESDHGETGCNTAIAELPDIILLDLMMPEVDGYEVLRRLKANAQTQPIPVLVLTASLDAASERRCMANGAAGYVRKPWDSGELQERIQTVLTQRRSRTRRSIREY